MTLYNKIHDKKEKDYCKIYIKTRCYVLYREYEVEIIMLIDDDLLYYYC